MSTPHQVKEWFEAKYRYGGVLLKGEPLFYIDTASSFLDMPSLMLSCSPDNSRIQLFQGNGPFGDRFDIVDFPRSQWPTQESDVEFLPEYYKHWKDADGYGMEMGAMYQRFRGAVLCLPSDAPLVFMKVARTPVVVVKLYTDLSWIDIGWKGPLITPEFETSKFVSYVGTIPDSLKQYTAEDILEPYTDFFNNKLPDQDADGGLGMYATFRSNYQRLRDLIIDRKLEAEDGSS